MMHRGTPAPRIIRYARSLSTTLNAPVVDVQPQLDSSHPASSPLRHRDLPVPKRAPADGGNTLEYACSLIDDEMPDRVSHGPRDRAGQQPSQTYACGPRTVQAALS